MSERESKRRGIALAATAGLVAVSLAGCDAGESDGASGALKWGMWVGDQADVEAWDAVAERAKEVGAPDLELQGAPFGDYFTKMSTQLSSGTAPCVVGMQSLRLQNFTSGLVDLTDKIDEETLASFAPGALDGMRVGDGLYGLPYDLGPVIMFYNADLFEEAGVELPQPGWTIEEFESANEKFRDFGVQGVALSADDMQLESTVLAYNGGRVIAEDGSLELDDEKFAEGLDWLASLVEDGYAAQVSSDGTTDDNAFTNAQAATMIDGPWSVLSMRNTVDFELGVTTLPAGAHGATTFSAGSGFGISASCAQPEEALKAVQGLTSEGALKGLAAAGRAFPARTSIQEAWYGAMEISGLDAAMEEAQATAVTLPGNPSSDQLAQAFLQNIPLAINGQETGAQVMERIAGQVTQ